MNQSIFPTHIRFMNRLNGKITVENLLPKEAHLIKGPLNHLVSTATLDSSQNSLPLSFFSIEAVLWLLSLNCLFRNRDSWTHMPCFSVSLFSSVSTSKKMVKTPNLKTMESPKSKSKIYPNQRLPPPKRGEIKKKIVKGFFSTMSGGFARKPPREDGGFLS